MRVKEMHPLCCISLESSGGDTAVLGDQSPDAASLSRTRSLPASLTAAGSDHGGPGSEAAVAGVLQKWTNYGKGWRSRWFMLRNGVLSYAKIRRPESLNGLLTPNDDVRFIGDRISAGGGDSHRRRNHHKTVAIVHLKISSFRESKSDERRFYIFTATKTLHLRSGSKSDREAWVEALVSTRSLCPLTRLSETALATQHDLSVSTARLKKRLADEGVSDCLVSDCEQIMLSEFSRLHSHLNLLRQDRSNLLHTLSQLEAANTDAEPSGIPDHYNQLTKNQFSSIGREYSTTESSDDIEKQEVEQVSEEDEPSFYDSSEYFTQHAGVVSEMDKPESQSAHYNIGFERRKKLPDPLEKEKGVSLWSMIKDNVGKDLTRVCLPVYFNEPISSLQKCCEDMEYSYLLDRAYEQGKAGNSLERALNVAAFAVSAYASSEGRHCKPFNPLLGETYEADFPDKGFRFFSEKVSHHPTLIACHSEGRGWKFWADSNLRTKFWGRSIQLDPVGDLTVEFDDGEVFQWSKVTTTIYNLILGKVYCDHHGVMDIRGNRQYSCKLKFKERSLLDRNPRQVNGFVEDCTGKKFATLFGKWDESMHYTNSNEKDCNLSSEALLLWKRTKPPLNLTRYNLTRFAITLNELTSGLQEKLPPTDSRLRPDQRHLENGEYEKANTEKQRLEKRQRMSRKLQESGWKPRWFAREGENGSFRYTGGYWEARDDGKWENCPNIFGEFDQGIGEPLDEGS